MRSVRRIRPVRGWFTSRQSPAQSQTTPLVGRIMHESEAKSRAFGSECAFERFHGQKARPAAVKHVSAELTSGRTMPLPIDHETAEHSTAHLATCSPAIRLAKWNVA
ncbi:hypothetical protein LPJ66_009937 [Kickxella alabastrina]|uniref:Uncharacterized protein n=1 Tax=Kickxella alabastrina TaxID=61397 RepID=A0ACC1I2J2_9FUNG|nr:hypothetical protein LPJ66_009937 [Kickxella alabastrina]